MFHSICPECGRVIASAARECPSCDNPASAEGTPAANGFPIDSDLPLFGSGAGVDPFEAMVAMVDAPVSKPPLASPLPIEAVGDSASRPSYWPDPLSPQPQSPKSAALHLPRPQLEGPISHVPTGGSVSIIEPQSAGPKASEPFTSAVLDQISISRPPSLPQTLSSSKPDLVPAQEAAHQPHKPVKLRMIAPAPLATPTPPLSPIAGPPLNTTSLPLVLRSASLPFGISGAVEAQFTGRTALPSSPAKVSRNMPYGWLASYMAAAHRLMRPSARSTTAIATSYGFAFSAPSPVLVPRLLSFHKQELRTVFPGTLVKRRPMPPWLWATLIGGTMLGAGVSNMFSVGATPPPARPPVAQTQSGAESTSTAPLSFNVPSNSLSKSIEVTGFRLTSDPGKKPEIEYIVVSHSPARLSGLNVYVTLHDASALPGQAPLCQFSFVTPDLDPYEAKQMSNSIENAHKKVTLPDWQGLRVDVQVGQ